MSGLNRLVRLALLGCAILLATPSTHVQAAQPIAPSAQGQQSDPVGPTKPVLVVNTPAQPVPVAGTITGDVNVANVIRATEAPRQPFHDTQVFSMSEGEYVAGSSGFTVPDGKQLVVTRASLSVQLPGGQNVGFRVNMLNPAATDIVAIHDLPGAASVGAGGVPSLVASASVDWIVPAAFNLTCMAIRDATTGQSTNGRCSISGYFVDVP